MKRLTLNTYINLIRPPAVLITFDDGGSTQFTEGFAYMNARGLKGTIYVVSELANTPGFVTTANLTTMQNAGWDIANHTSDHTNLTTLSLNDVRLKLSSAREWLESNGFTRASRHVGYPYGANNATVNTAMDAERMLTGRTIVESLDVIPTDHPFTLNGYILDKTKSLAVATALVDAAISQRKLLTLYIHSINSNPGDYDVSIATFQGFIDYIVSQNLPTITISELYTDMYA